MTWKILQGDALEVLKTLPDESVHCCVTSPPYWGLRDYGVSGQLGLEKTPELYVSKMTEVFREVRRVLRSDGTLWLNIGDSYCGYWGDAKALAENRPSAADTNGWTNGFSMNSKPKYETLRATGIKPKDLCGIPWLLAFALRSDGWYLRQDIIWSKPNPMPESVTDRCTKAHEYLFLLSKSARYYYDGAAIAEPCATPMDTKAKCGFGGPKCNTEELCHSNEPGKSWDPTETRNKRSVWEVTTKAYSEAHFATFPPDLIEPCILAGCPEGGTVLDPFCGAGTTGLVATRFNRNFVGIELSPAYVEMAKRRIEADAPLFNAQASEPLGQPSSEHSPLTLPLSGTAGTVLQDSLVHESVSTDAE